MVALSRARWPRAITLLALCAAYVQGGLVKLLDFHGAVEEVVHFGMPAPSVLAVATIITELVGSLMVVSGILRWAGALWLAAFTLVATWLACRFWELPAGHERFASANTFWEHIGLIGGFLFVAISDLKRQ